MIIDFHTDYNIRYKITITMLKFFVCCNNQYLMNKFGTFYSNNVEKLGQNNTGHRFLPYIIT